MKRFCQLMTIVVMMCLCPLAWAAEIHERVKADDLVAVKSLIETDPSAIKIVDEGRRSPLHWAARGGNPEMIRLLVDKGADVNAADENGIVPLHSLATRGHVEGARILLAGGADVNKVMPNRQTAIYLAALGKNLEMVRLLTEHKADLEHVDDYGRTVLVLASREMAGLDIVRLLLDLGAHVNAVDRWQDTALTLAAWRGTGDVVDLLLDRKASIPSLDWKRTQILWSAVEKNLSRLFGLLMDAGTEVTGRDERGRSLVHAAAEGGAVPMIQALLAKGLGIDPTDGNGWTPLHFATDLGRHEALAFLVDKGADLKARTLMGQTAANLAADNQDPQTLKWLEARGLALTPPRFPELKGPYMGQKAPGRNAQVFAPGIVSARYGLHSSIVFSPDGTEAFWAVMLPDRAVGYSANRTFQSKLEKGRWTYPREAVFEGVKLEDVPFFHPDGKTLYDMAERPFPDGRNTGKENLWAWPKGEKDWQKPHPLPPEVNDAIYHWQFSLDRSGNLYFCATRAEGLGQHDVYCCRFENGRYLRPENLGERVNSPGSEEYPYITPDGQTLLLMRNYNIYASFKDPSGQWSKARPLGPEVNTRSIEQLPIISPDGKYLFFNRDQKSHWIDASVIDDIRRIETARFGQTAAAEALEPLLTAGKIEEAKARFSTMRGVEAQGFYVDEAEFNALGYRFLQQRNLPAAVAVMEMGTVAFPESWNAWDSLGEALRYSGLSDRSEQAYEKSLSLNPESPSGRESLRTLRSERLGREWDRQHATTVALKHKPGQQTGLKGAYLGQTPPGTKPVLFAPGIVSSAQNMEFSQTFSPDGLEFYFTRRAPEGHNTLMVSHLEKKGWTAPVEAEFAKGFPANEPHVTPDGQRLYFGCQRPRPDGRQEYGIWVVERTATGWGEPRFHGDGMFVSVSLKGNLYWTDITMAAGGGAVVFPFENGQFGPPQKMPPAINAPRDAAHAFIAPDESFLVFDSYSRPEGQGGEGDLYVSFCMADGSWSPAQNLGDEVNGPGTNFCPSVSPDGKYLFFSCADDLYWVSSEVIQRLRPKNLEEQERGGIVAIPGGSFTMGSPASQKDRQDNEGPQHRVSVNAFLMGACEVTQAQWLAVMATNPSGVKGDKLPVEQVSWYDALVYCNKRSIQEGLNPCYRIGGRTDPGSWGAVPSAGDAVLCDFDANGYRLPTEAEWEYACRAGTTTATAFGDSLSSTQANFNGSEPYNGASIGPNLARTSPVGSYPPNAFGLYDMYGNVFEWCWDGYGTYGAGAQTNPTGAAAGGDRVARGACWGDGGQCLQSSRRGHAGPELRDGGCGFRLVRSIVPQ